MGFSWTTFGFEIVNFVLFLYLLRRLLYAPLERSLRQRRDKHERAARELTELEARAEALRQRLLDEQREFTAERERLLADARVAAGEERAHILKRASADLADLERREAEKLTRERHEAELDIARASIDAARTSAANLLRGLNLPEVDAAMTQRLLDALEQHQGPAPSAHAELESAVELDDAKRARLREALSARLGVNLELQFSLDPQLISGLRLRLGNTVYDASLRAQLARAAARAERRLGAELASAGADEGERA